MEILQEVFCQTTIQREATIQIVSSIHRKNPYPRQKIKGVIKLTKIIKTITIIKKNNHIVCLIYINSK